MNIAKLIADLLDKDIHLWVEEDKLRVNAPKGALSAEMRETLTAHKADIIAFLQMDNGSANIIQRANRDQAVPLSFSQHRLWFLDQFEPGSTAYSVLFTIQVDGKLDLTVLEKTYNEIVRRHEALRTVFVLDETGQPGQKINPYTPFLLPVHKVDDLPEEKRGQEAIRYLQEQARIPFDLSHGPLYRFLVVRLSEQTHLLFYNIHHTVYDGWSTGVFFGEMYQLYNAFAAGQASPLAELPFQYADYSIWQRQTQTPEAFQKQLEYWTNKLSGKLPILELPADRPRPSFQTFNGALHSVIFSTSMDERLRAVANQHDVTLFTVLLAAFKSLVYRYTGQADLIVGTPVANRHSVEVEKLIGFFVNTLVLRTDLSGNPTFVELLHRLRDGSFEDFAHQEMPFEMLVEALHLQRDTSHSPVFQLMFIYQNLPSRFVKIPEWKVKPLLIDPGSAKFDLTVSVGESEEGLHCTFEYNSDLFDHETIRRMMGHYQNILEAVCSDPQQRLEDLPLLTEVEREQALVEWNNTQVDYPTLCVQELFEAQAKQTPEAVAVQFEEQTITYAELDRRTNQLAHFLKEQGVGPEILVGIHIERSIEMIVALLGVLKVGGAYLPLDPQFPKDRLAYMVEDSHAAILLTQSHLLANLAANQAKVICLDTDWPAVETCSSAQLDIHPNQTDLAYVLYTSGSTGRPKGVQVAQRGLVNFLASMQCQPGITQADVLLSVTTLSFDIAGLELYLPLISGARLVLVSSMTSADGGKLAQAMEQSRATIMQATPATWRLLIASGWRGSAGLKILCGGEALPPDLAEDLLARCGSLWNMYGPTETTIWSTLCQVNAGNQPITIGRPIANTQLYLLDPHLQPVPIGVPGELYIGGDGLARGYLNRPELTDEKFVAHPFQPGARLYRTGDLCRYLPDGKVEFLGRIDSQVKLRGFRIELGEIETVLAQHSAIDQAVVTAREDTPGDKRLVAYFTAQALQPPSTSELRAFLQEKLPEYMIPSIFMEIKTLPLTPNGKVDRRALPAPEYSRPELATQFTPPRNEIERVLAVIWQEALKVTQVGIHDNFFELGGHSLLLMQIHNRVHQQFQTDLTIAQMFQYQTIQALAQYLSKAQSISSDAPKIVRVIDRRTPPPLSFSQQRMWFLEQINPEHSAYILTYGKLLDRCLDIHVLEKSLAEIVRRHEGLRTSFHRQDEHPVQVIHPPMPIPVNVVDLTHLDDGVLHETTQQLIDKESKRPFDLSEAPLLRVTLYHLRTNADYLVINMHHIIGDNASMQIFSQELSALYQAFQQGLPSPLAEIPVQYADYVFWQNEILQGDLLVKQIAYWKEKLSGDLSRLELPADRPWAESMDVRAGEHIFSLPARLSKDLQGLAQRQGVTLFNLLLTGFKVLLYRLSGQEDLTVGTPVWGRSRPELESIIGLFLNTLALRTDLSGSPTFLQALERVNETSLGAFSNQDVPFERLVEEIQPERSLTRHPFFDIFVNFVQPNFHLRDDLPLQIYPVKLSEPESKFSITLYIAQADDQITFDFFYRKALYSSERIACLVDQYQALLEQIVKTPLRCIDEYALVSPAAESILPDPTHSLSTPETEPVFALVQQWAKKQPDLPAVEQNGRQWSYRELTETTYALASALQRAGCAPGDVIAVSGQKSFGLIASMLAVTQGGGVLLTIDPALPERRQETMLQEANARWFIQVSSAHEPARAFDLTGGISSLHVNPDTGQLWGEPTPVMAEEFISPVKPEDPAYIFFTSGTTNVPKGVLGTHRGLSHFLSWQRETFQIGPGDRAAQLTALSFDVVLRDIFTPLSSGACLCLPDARLGLASEALLRWLAQEKITLLHTVPAIAQTWLNIVDSTLQLNALRLVFFAGEPLYDTLCLRWRETFAPHCAIVNLYGPTETTLAKCYYIVPEVPLPGVQPVGRPLPQTQALILNKHGALCGIAEPGEIVIRTPFRTLGYINAPEEQQRRFQPNPFTQDPLDLIYRTGDNGRYRPDGTVDILGRQDDQVKIHGVRIELSEVAAALQDLPQVKSAVVTVRKEGSTPYLAAYVVTARGVKLGAEALRYQLAERLPLAAVPSRYTFLDRLPLTPNGKIDRSALPEPEALSPIDDRLSQPRDVVEAKLIQIWKKLLHVPEVGIQDDFFLLGGHSMLAVQMLIQIEETFGVNLPLTSLFKKSNIEYLAGLINEQRGPSTWSSLVHIQPQGSRPPLFCVHGLTGDVFWFGRLVPYMDPDQPLWGLQSQGLDGVQEPLTNIEEMAKRYIEEMKSIQPLGPYFICGYSFGGSLSYEIACQLEQQGDEVRLLAIIDHANAKSGYYKVKLSPGFFIALLKNLPHRVYDIVNLKPYQLYARVVRKLQGIYKLIALKLQPPSKRYIEAGVIIDHASQMPAHIRKVIEHNYQAALAYNPGKFHNQLTLLRARGGRLFVSHDPLMGWGKYAQNVKVRMVPGSHLSLFQPHRVQYLAQVLQSCLDEVHSQSEE